MESWRSFITGMSMAFSLVAIINCYIILKRDRER